MGQASSLFLCALSLLSLSYAQISSLKPQTDTWNSTFKFSPSQLTGANLSDVQVANIEQALNFERSNWATGSVATDDFYTAPSNSSSLPLGSVLKVEPFVDTTNYTIPPNVALSRILYTTQNLLNETIPTSAIILWPYLPIQYPNLTAPNPSINSSSLPLIAWLHGTSGVLAECAPSHLRNIAYQYSGVFELVLSGYVIVAPDYQGLGVNTTSNGSEIIHPYIAAPAAANDAFYAIQATQSAFAHLVSKEFVIMGHSQGGNAAWGSAIRQAKTPVDGYLGAIAASPATNLTSLITLLGHSVPPVLSLIWSQAIKSLYPLFNESSIITPEGLARLRLAKDQNMCNSAIGELLADFPHSDNGALFHSNWTECPEFKSYLSTTDIGDQPIVGPMLVVQGTADPSVPYQFTDASVSATCAVSGGRGIKYARFDGVGHIPVLYASQRIWLDFLGERFSAAGSGADGDDSKAMTADHECVTTNYTSLPMPVGNYQQEVGHFLSLAAMGYQLV